MSIQFSGGDLFCGAGGATSGIEQAEIEGMKIASVTWCINHDETAIESHAANHTHTKHFTEDIRNIKKLLKPRILQEKKPDMFTFLWVSAECTHYSIARGGLPRDADSRTLPEYVPIYARYLNVDYILVENVREFMSWGDLDVNGKPVSKDKGRLFVRWVKKICALGYDVDYKILNSADFGAFTSRKRLFMIFAKKGLPIAWPSPTHSKNGNELFGLKKWNAVKETLDLNDKGTSIFARKKPLSEATHKRIYKGLIKHTPNPFLQQHNYGSDDSRLIGLDKPANTITTSNRFSLIQSEFLLKYHGNGENILESNQACSTLTTKDRLALVQTQFLDEQYSNSKPRSINEPSGTLVTNPKQKLVTAHYLMNPQFSSEGGSIDNPCFTLIARMDKKPPYLISTETGELAIEIYEADSYWVRKIKEFMAAHGIIDIYMRMLKVPELLRIQGFGDKYILKGNQTQQKKFIGNAVVPVIPKKMIEALYVAISEMELRKAA